MFAFVGDIGYYQYHHVAYQGFLAETIVFTNEMDDQVYNSILYISSWASTSINFPSYVPFSDPKTVQLDGYDCLFFQNIQKYFFIYIPACLLSYFTGRWLFSLIINSPYSIFLRNYSFGAYLLELLVFNKF